MFTILLSLILEKVTSIYKVTFHVAFGKEVEMTNTHQLKTDFSSRLFALSILGARGFSTCKELKHEQTLVYHIFFSTCLPSADDCSAKELLVAK